MTTYRVTWEIDIDADNPREAAEKARQIQLDAESTAVVFTVGDIGDVDDDNVEEIDLLDEEEG